MPLITTGRYGENVSSPLQSYQGGGYEGFLGKLLADRIRGENPLLDELRQVGRKDITDSTNRGLRNIKEQLAASGFRGIGANAINDLYENESDAIAGLNVNLAQFQDQQTQNAIQQLLGLNATVGQQKLSALQSDRQFELGVKNLLEGRRQFDEQLDFNKDQADTDFLDVLGGILGGGLGALTGTLGGGLGFGLLGDLFGSGSGSSGGL